MGRSQGLGQRLKRGEVRWCTLTPPDGRLPVVILTRDSAIGYLNTVTVAPVTTTIRDVPSHVVLGPDNDGVPLRCAVNLDNLQTVPKSRIGELVAVTGPTRLRQAEAALCFALGLDDWQAGG